MKKLLLIFSVLFIISCRKENDKTLENSISTNNSTSKTTRDSLKSKNDFNSVDGIKNEYNLVNSKLIAKKLDSVTVNYECEKRSGNVVYYSENGILKVIKHFNADSHFSSTENYFMNEGKPYFVFKDDTVWSFDGGTPENPKTKDDITEQRFYIVNGKPIQCLEKKYTLKSNSTNNPKSENIQNKELKNCSIDELYKTFNLLMKNKDKKGTIKCL